MRHEDALLVMAWLAAHPGSDSNTLGRIVTNGGTPKQVSSAGYHVALDLCRFGYVKATRETGRNQSRTLYTLTPKGRQLLKEP
jgi:hypothetical protein